MNKFKKIYKRIEAIEKKVAELEGRVQVQPRKFIPEDSIRKHYEENEKCKCSS